MYKPKIVMPPPSWEIFDECSDCFAGPKRPCYQLNRKSKNLKELSFPHKNRKRLKDE